MRLTFILKALGTVHKALLERSIQFKKIMIAESISTVVGAAVGIFAALTGFGVWSLAIQSLVTTTIGTVIFWIVSSWRPAPMFVWAELRTLTRFSLNLSCFQILNYFARNADKILIGRFLGSQDLGYYSLAYQIMLYPVGQISSVISRVLFPVLSQIQDDEDRMRKIFILTTSFISVVTFPMMFGVWGLAEPLVHTILDLTMVYINTKNFSFSNSI